MTSFNSLLSSISGAPPSIPASKREEAKLPPSDILRNGAPPKQVALPSANMAAGVKRKPEEQLSAPLAKTSRVESDGHGKSIRQGAAQATHASKASNTALAASRPGMGHNLGTEPAISRVASVQGTAATAGSSAKGSRSGALNDTAKPKRGFASLLEKAKAAQAAAKAVGSSTIKHKPAPKLTKRDRQRMIEEATKQKMNGRSGKLLEQDRSRSGTPVEVKSKPHSKQPGPAYKGTMRKPVERQESSYTGTMNKSRAGVQASKPAPKRQLAKDKYGGYASWSDLDEAEDEDEDEDEAENDSDASSDMMDAGFDDMEAEERRALEVAKREDREALEEEERHRREKLERRRKLQALSKSAAAKKKF